MQLSPGAGQGHQVSVQVDIRIQSPYCPPSNSPHHSIDLAGAAPLPLTRPDSRQSKLSFPTLSLDGIRITLFEHVLQANLVILDAHMLPPSP